MILADVRSYVADKRQVTLADVALHFDVSEDAAQGMLDVWVRKGKIRRSRLNAACGSSCSQCAPATTEVYLWSGATAQAETALADGNCGV